MAGFVFAMIVLPLGIIAAAFVLAHTTKESSD
jgi:hypothetical protein